MSYVLRQVHAPGKSARADEATIEALSIATITGTIRLGPYLEWSDPDANGGMGDDRWTTDVSKAKRFASFTEAMDCWSAQSRVRPRRPDGKPNRPMTAYSVSAERVGE